LLAVIRHGRRKNRKAEALPYVLNKKTAIHARAAAQKKAGRLTAAPLFIL